MKIRNIANWLISEMGSNWYLKCFTHGFVRAGSLWLPHRARIIGPSFLMNTRQRSSVCLHGIGIVNIHFSLLHKDKDLNMFDLAHYEALRSVYSIFRGIPRSCFWSLDPVVLKMQKAEIKNALDSITFLDFAQAITGQLPFNRNTQVTV